MLKLNFCEIAYPHIIGISATHTHYMIFPQSTSLWGMGSERIDSCKKVRRGIPTKRGDVVVFYEEPALRS